MNIKARSRYFMLCFFAIAGIIFSPSALALLTDAQAVNTAGLQRMLSQRIARDFLLIGADIDAKKSQKALDQHIADFEKGIVELQEYATQKPDLEASLGEVTQSWSMYRVLAVSMPSKESAVEIMRASDEILQHSEALIAKIQQTTRSQPLTIIGFSGRQRMLSQRIAKLYLAIHWKVPYPGLEAAFNRSIQDYENGLAALEDEPSNTQEINNGLLTVRAQWDFAKSGFRQHQGGNALASTMVKTSDNLLKLMNDMTLLYVKQAGNE